MQILLTLLLEARKHFAEFFLIFSFKVPRTVETRPEFTDVSQKLVHLQHQSQNQRPQPQRCD